MTTSRMSPEVQRLLHESQRLKDEAQRFIQESYRLCDRLRQVSPRREEGHAAVDDAQVQPHPSR